MVHAYGDFLESIEAYTASFPEIPSPAFFFWAEPHTHQQVSKLSSLSEAFQVKPHHTLEPNLFYHHVGVFWGTNKVRQADKTQAWLQQMPIRSEIWSTWSQGHMLYFLQIAAIILNPYTIVTIADSIVVFNTARKVISKLWSSISKYCKMFTISYTFFFMTEWKHQ